MSILTALFALIVGVILSLLLAGARAKARLQAAFPPVGQLIDVGGYRLHAKIQGKGDFTVVFDSGVGGIATHWEKVQPVIAKYAFTLSYDRAGLGWSEIGKQPRNFKVMADELKLLLEAANLPIPYILVGHSFGGVVIRQFARAYPERVAGLVLVDSAHEEQFIKRFPAQVREMVPKMIKSMKPMILAFASGIPALLLNRMPLTPGLSESSAEAERAIRVMSGKHMQTMLNEMDAIVHRPPQPLDTLRNVPLMVLSHGVAQPAPNMSDEVNTAYEEAWQQMQHELAQLSSNSQHLIVEGSGHDIQIEKPQAVIDAVKQVVMPIHETS